MSKLNIVFFGTPDFSVPCLELLTHHPDVNIISVISMPDRKSGRGLELHSPEVINYAKDNKLNFFQTENINKETDYIQNLKSKNIDAFIVLAFAQFLGKELLQIPKMGCFNIHTSLLPKYRGAAPIQHAILNGDTSTGVSIQKMVKKMDAGDICHADPVIIQKNETGGQLYTRLKFQAALSLNEFIADLKNNDLSFQQQDTSKVSFAPTLKREDGKLDFLKEDASTIYNKVRGLFPWPGTFCYLNKKRLKIFNVEENDLALSPGEVNTKYNQIIIGTSNGSIRLCEIQLEGKKACSDTELLNGLKVEFTIN